MGFIIDTSIWVDIERGCLAPADIAAVTKQQPVYISPITIAELQYGAEITQDAGVKQKRLSALTRLMRKAILRIDERTAEVFGRLAAQLKKTGRGHNFRIQDLWIASQCVQHNFRLITFNRKDFDDIPGLELVPL